MTKLQTKLATAAATAAMLAQSAVLPAFAGEYTFEISGNGSDSDSAIDFDRENETGVFQTNDATVVNDISVSSNTGGNDVSDNTGGDVDVETGDVEMEATIVNQLNSNSAEVEACDCDGETEIKIDGNGTESDNEVEVDTKNQTAVVQDNNTEILNAVELEGKTGRNDVKDNTGGAVDVETGDVTIAPVEIANVAGVNYATVGSHNGGDASLGLQISGNGSDSDNDVDVDSQRATGIFQTNRSAILNDLYFGGYTGRNDVSDNTGASEDPALTTGDVFIAAGVYNETGYNMADADCGCVLDVTGKIHGNGTDSDSDLRLDLDDTSEVAQDNLDELLNAGEVMSNTGDNEAEDNTSGEINVETGDTETIIETANLGGYNSFGGVEIEMPFGFSFSFGL